MTNETQKPASGNKSELSDLVMCCDKTCSDYDEFFNDNCGYRTVQLCKKNNRVERPKDTSEAYRKMVLMQAKINNLEAKVFTVLEWCHGNIESNSQVATFAIQVRDCLERDT